MNFDGIDRHTLKALAFPYHYGQWRSEREARMSIAGQAARELAIRSGGEPPAPQVIGKTTLYKTAEFVKDLFGKVIRVDRAAKVVSDFDLFLFDLDGTLISSYMDNEDKDYHKWEYLPGRAITLNALRTQQKKVAVVTNQAGVDFGYNTADDWDRKMREVSTAFFLELEDFYVCFAHPNGAFRPDLEDLEQAEEDAIPKEWDMRRRKPSGKMIEEAVERFMVPKDRVVYVGDLESDAHAAADAGVAYIHADEFFA